MTIHDAIVPTNNFQKKATGTEHVHQKHAMACHGGFLFEAPGARNVTYTKISASTLAVGRTAGRFLMAWALPSGPIRAAKCYVCHSSAF